MVTLLIILFSVLSGAAPFLRRQQRTSAPSRVSFLVGLVCLIVGLVITTLYASQVERDFARRSWPTVEGEVIDSRVEGERAQYPLVIYAYEIGGQSHTDSSHLHEPNFGGKKKRERVAVHSIAAYPPGATVLVYYDPSDPGNSTLTPSVYWADYGRTASGATFIILGIFFALRYVTGRRSASRPTKG